MINVDSSDVNKLTINISGVMPLRTDYTAARAGYLDNINESLPSNSDWTDVRATHLDHLKYHTGGTYISYGASSNRSNEGNHVYTVTASKVLVITSVSFGVGDNISNRESYVYVRVSGNGPILFTARTGSNWSNSQNNHTGGVTFNNGIYVPAASVIHSFAHEADQTSVLTWISWKGYEINA